MAERLFFALWPGEAERAALARLLDTIPKRGGRLTHPEDLHLTLAFLGELPPDQRACCEAAVEQVSGEPFDLRLDCIGYWPRPRILWCGARVSPPSLLDLVGALTGALHPCGYRAERRPFAAHVTLARKAMPYKGTHGAEWHLDWLVRGFVLATSTDGPPPRYRILRRWPLGAASPPAPLCDNAPL